MFQKLRAAFSIYLFSIVLFCLQKLVFIAVYASLLAPFSGNDVIQIIKHGLSLDLSIGAYLTILPCLLLIISIWTDKKYVFPIAKGYFGLISLVLSIIFVSDIILYEHWGFRLDATPLFYLKTPKEALASASIGLLMVGFVMIAVLTYALCKIYIKLYDFNNYVIVAISKKVVYSVVGLIITAALIIPIRGGFSVSTMNVGHAYFSDKMIFNHAAVNPAFSLLESVSREQDFSNQFQFIDKDIAVNQFNSLINTDTTAIPKVFTKERPNIVFIVLESFMATVSEPFGGRPGVTNALNKYASESIVFTNFYANSFRTDRGLVSILSAFPGMPTTSLMKYPRKFQNVGSIPSTLIDNGYKATYYYGGDADFTNMRAYLRSNQIEKIISEDDFPADKRNSKWGALDGDLVQKVISEYQPNQQQTVTIIQTSSSHEPFEVPYHHIDNEPYVNSVGYVDSCIGSLLDFYKKQPDWDNTIIVLVADHTANYPKTMTNTQIERYHIPCMITGGAIKEAMKVNTIASQMDLAHTLLYQLGMDASKFEFSKNIFNPKQHHFAYFTQPGVLGYIDSLGVAFYDLEQYKTVTITSTDSNHIQNAKTILQYQYLLMNKL